MAVTSHKLGPGTLSFGSVGSPMDATAQVTSVTVNPTTDSEDAVTTLSGESLGGARTYGAEIAVTAVQDSLAAAGLIRWSWTNRGSDVPFTFTPNTDLGVSISGVVTVDPISVGGDIGKKNTSDFTWACVGFPIFADDV